MSTKILALEKDLFFSVKIRDTLRHYDLEVSTVRSLSAFEQRLTSETEVRPALVIVNIATVGVDWEAVIRLARQQRLPVLAFGSHMDLEARERALKAGALKVVANSKFSSDMPGLVQRMLGTDGHTADAEEDHEQTELFDAARAKVPGCIALFEKLEKGDSEGQEAARGDSLKDVFSEEAVEIDKTSVDEERVGGRL